MAILSSDKEFYIESNGFKYVAAEFALKEIPSLKIVHFVRDPRDFAVSYFNWIETKLKSKIANRLIPFWNPVGFMADEISIAEWIKLTRLQKFFWYWYFKNNYIENHYSNDSYLRIKFKDLTNKHSRENTLRELTKFIGVNFKNEFASYFVKRENESVVKAINKSRIDSLDIEFLTSNYKGMMDKYGYK